MQNSVTNHTLATGIPGEFSRSGNQETRGAILASESEADNVVGRVVKTVKSSDHNVGVAADGNFAGILSSPKTAIRPTLDAQAFLLNATQIEVAERGYMFVNLLAAANIGDFVYYSNLTGELATAAPDEAAPVDHSRLPGGLVQGQNVAGAGVGEIYFDIAGSAVAPESPESPESPV